MKNKMLVSQLLLSVIVLILCCSHGPAWASVASTTTSVPVLTLSTSDLEFGSQAVNSQTDFQIVTLTNTGSALLTFSHIGISGALSPDGWGTQFATSNDCGPTLAVNASCAIHARFAPLSTGFIATTLGIQSNASASMAEINLAGQGIASPLAISTNRVEFGKQAVGTSSAVQQVTLTNVGTAPIHIDSIWWAGGPPEVFAVSSTCGATLAPSASCVVRMRFNPKTTDLVRSVVYVTNSATNNVVVTPLQIGMAGTGVATPAP